MGPIVCSFMGWRLRFLHSAKTLTEVSESHLMGSLQLLWLTVHLITSTDQTWWLGGSEDT